MYWRQEMGGNDNSDIWRAWLRYLFQIKIDFRRHQVYRRVVFAPVYSGMLTPLLKYYQWAFFVISLIYISVKRNIAYAAKKWQGFAFRNHTQPFCASAKSGRNGEASFSWEAASMIDSNGGWLLERLQNEMWRSLRLKWLWRNRASAQCMALSRKSIDKARAIGVAGDYRHYI